MAKKTTKLNLDILEIAKNSLIIEADAINDLIKRLDSGFIKAVEKINSCTGKVIVTAVGKSGHIGRKIAATFASIGTPAFFVHPTEAYHGDLGMIKANDIVLAISNSGESDEIINIVPVIKKIGAQIILLTSSLRSSLAKMSDIVINVSVDKEADILNLAPTASTTATLALGDAMAVALQKLKGFKEKDFALLHPGGALGRSFLRANSIMLKGKALGKVHKNCTLKEAIIESSKKNLGILCIVDNVGKLCGILTDGDIRRIFLKYDGEELVFALTDKVENYIIKNPLIIYPNTLCSDAIKIMEEKSTYVMPVVNKTKKLMGVLRMHELVSYGFAIKANGNE